MMKQEWLPGRRDFLRATGVAIFGYSLPMGCTDSYRSTRVSNNDSADNANAQLVRFGMVTDSHYADTPTLGTRFYRNSKAKMAAAVELMNAQQVDFVVELGDFKDQAHFSAKTPDKMSGQSKSLNEQNTLSYLRCIENVYADYKGPRYHVLGNHDMDSISKQQFLAKVTNTGIAKKKSYYSFDTGGVHFVVLDACFAKKVADYTDYDHGNFDWQNTWLPPQEIAWLKKDLANTSATHIIVFIHQLLDGTGSVYVNNASDVRKLLEHSSKVRVVFQGHHHPGAYSYINGIHYYTLRAMVEGAGLINNSCAVVNIYNNGDIKVQGYYKAVSRTMKS